MCKEIKSTGEGHWPISEKTFTKERALKATKTLNQLISLNEVVADYVSIENELLYIQGHMLKKYAKKNDEYFVKEYCNFIENEAYVRH